MGRIIKLTEQDLARIVRRVINEAEGDPINIRVWSTTDITKPVVHRLDISNIELKDNMLYFNYVSAGMENAPNRTENLLNTSISNKGVGRSPCHFVNKLVIRNLSGVDTTFYTSKDGDDLLKPICRKYALIGNSVGSTDYT